MPWGNHDREDNVVNNSIALIITSDYLTSMNPKEAEKLDETSRSLKDFFVAHDYLLTHHVRIPNNEELIQKQVKELVQAKTGIIVVCGGTGLGRRDVSIEAVSPLLEKMLPGFGEQFRRVSYEKIGIRGLLSRAIAGVMQDSIIIVTPGSPKGARDALELLHPLIPHIQHLRSKK